VKTRPLGRSDLAVSVVGLGTNNFGTRLDLDGSARVLDACETHGINLLDTADLYGEGASEEYLGRLLRGRRDRFVVATKVGLPWEDGSRPGGLDPAYIVDSVRGSLRRLNTDYIDLLQLHVLDPRVPLEAVLETLRSLVDTGMVRHVGCSNFMTWELVEWVLAARNLELPGFVSIQSEYSMLVRDAETELLHACQRMGVGLIPYRPLAQGFLTGKYARGDEPPAGTRLALQDRVRRQRETDENWTAVEAAQELAAKKGCTTAQLAIAWLLSRQQVSSVIAGASNPQQIEDNAQAADVELTPDELNALEASLPPIPGGAIGALGVRAHLRGD
jgi:aryl-alcohol dehydrogenase-like predicted oxidoreductase